MEPFRFFIAAAAVLMVPWYQIHAADVENSEPTPAAIAMNTLQRCEEAALQVATQSESSSTAQVVDACAAERTVVTQMLTKEASAAEKAAVAQDIKSASQEQAQEVLQTANSIAETLEEQAAATSANSVNAEAQ